MKSQRNYRIVLFDRIMDRGSRTTARIEFLSNYSGHVPHITFFSRIELPACAIYSGSQEVNLGTSPMKPDITHLIEIPLIGIRKVVKTGKLVFPTQDDLKWLQFIRSFPISSDNGPNWGKEN